MKLLLATISIFSTFLVYSQFGYTKINDAIPISSINSCGNVDSCFTLTPNATNQSGAVWDTKKINLNNNFDATFCLTFGNGQGWGADGVAFVMRGDNQDTMGNLGAWLGAGAISPSVIIEFDTWQNTDPGINDLAADHTALYFNGDFTNTILGPTPLLTNSGNVDVGNSHTVRVVWNTTTQRLRMFFDGVQRINYQGDIVNTVFSGNNLITWGFTASTGGASNLQQVCFPKYQITLEDTKTICENDSILLSYYNPNITSYRWTYEDGTVIKNWNSLDFATPFNLDDSSFYASQAGKYYFDVELNNQALKDSIELIVVPLPQKAFANAVDLLCLAETNYILTAPQTGGDTYSWSTSATSQQINVVSEGEYTVTVTEPINSCKTLDTIKIITFCKDESICAGDSATISFYEDNITSYKWSSEDGTVFKNWNNLDFTTPFNLNDTVFYPSQAGRYYLDIAIGSQVFRDSLDLTVIQLPTKPFVEEIILNCFEDNNYSLNAQNVGNSFLWSTGETTQQITVNTSGIYSVIITEPILSCKNYDTLKIVSFCKDTIICAGDFATISFYEENITSYKWTSKEDGTVYKDWNNVDFTTPFNLNDTVFYPSQAGTYILDLKIKSQVIKDSVKLEVISIPLKPFIETEITTCLDQKAYVLDALNTGNTFLWSTNDTTQQISVEEAGLYFVEITEPILSCKNYDTLNMISFCKTEIICPNIFTPNGDLLNDYYEITLTNDFTWIKDFQFRVFNRWNELVYSVENNLVKWDGTFNEKELTNGVYFYIYTYKDAFSDEEFKGNGNIQLVR